MKIGQEAEFVYTLIYGRKVSAEAAGGGAGHLGDRDIWYGNQLGIAIPRH
jgi:hypothetical protein